MNKQEYIKKQKGLIQRKERESLNGHRSAVFWFTGLSGSGKSTLTHAVEKRFFDLNYQVNVFDGDNVRHGLCRDLGFTPEERKENVRRIAEVAKLAVVNGSICLCAFITPLVSHRHLIHDILGDDYFEIYIKCSVEECARRDIKGYYKLAKKGMIKNYTGVSAPYEIPSSPDLIINTEKCSFDDNVEQISSFIVDKICVESSERGKCFF